MWPQPSWWECLLAIAVFVALLVLIGHSTWRRQRDCSHTQTVIRQCHAASALAYGGCGALCRECLDCDKVLEHDVPSPTHGR